LNYLIFVHSKIIVALYISNVVRSQLIILFIGVAAGSYIWGPTLQHYMNTDPEVLAFRKKSQLERELNKIEKQTK
jgi:hypothetical protein